MERDQLIARLLGSTGPDPSLDADLAAALGCAPGPAYTGDPGAAVAAARRLGCIVAVLPTGSPGGGSVAALWPPAGGGAGPLLMLGPDPARAACAALAGTARRGSRPA